MRAIVEAAMARCDCDGSRDAHGGRAFGRRAKARAIARALAQEPRVLLLDEPAAFLDVRHRSISTSSCRRRSRASSSRVVVVMHDLNAAAQYATRVVLAKNGELVAVGSVSEVMTYARLKETFDADLYVGPVNEITQDRFFLPMRRSTKLR
jgi:iron complex transport system ATP-binding protein